MVVRTTEVHPSEINRKFKIEIIIRVARGLQILSGPNIYIK